MDTQAQLESVAEEVTSSDIFVMKLQHVQHICRRISARPAQPAGTSSPGTPIGLLLTLNPTPAVCGESRPLATQFIRQVCRQQHAHTQADMNACQPTRTYVSVNTHIYICQEPRPLASKGRPRACLRDGSNAHRHNVVMVCVCCVCVIVV